MTGLLMWWVAGEWPFEIAGFVHLALVLELVNFVGGKFGCDQPRGLVVRSLPTKHEVPGSIPGSTIGIFPCRERFPW